MLAQGAVAAIRSGCEMLRDGKAEIDKFKKTVEGGVSDAKAIYKEVTGLWGWIQNLFGATPKRVVEVKPAVNAAPTATPAKKTKKQAEPELSYEEYKAKAVHEICEHLKVFFEAQRQLKAHCRELEEASKTTANVADAAIDRIELEWQLKELQSQVTRAMIYETPQELGLGALYKDFLQMYDQILEEQEFDRQLKIKKGRDEQSQRDHRREILIYKGVYAAAVIFALLEMIGLYLTL
jgi:hypothetical protein